MNCPTTAWTIHTAINDGKKTAFRYFDYDSRKSRVYRKDGAAYQVTPVALCWSEDKYYLIAHSAEHGELRHYRVDRMSDVEVQNEDADRFDHGQFNVTEHIRRVFGMYGGETVHATLTFDASLVNVILDYFGQDASMKELDGGRVEVQVDVSVSPVFLGWMFQFGGRAKIVGPDSLLAAMRELLQENMQKYIPVSNKADS